MTKTIHIPFFILIILIVAFMSYFIYTRFIKELNIPQKTKTFFKYYLIFNYFGVLLYFILRKDVEIDGTVLLFFSSLLGIVVVLFFTSLTYHIFNLFLKFVPFREEKREFFKKTLDVSFGFFALAYLFKGISEGVAKPILNQVEIKIKDFPFDNFNIIHLTDFHIGKTIKRDFVEDVVERVNALKADLIVITGDLADGMLDDIKKDLEPLKNLQSKHGTFMIYGNHEYYYEPFKLREFLPTLNIKLLENESVRIGENGEYFNLSGIFDLSGKRFGFFKPDFLATFEKMDFQKPTILLAHQPRQIKSYHNIPVDLILCGHTHGGQIFPFGYIVKALHKYLNGLYTHSKKTQVFVSRGTGYWGPPMRVFAPSEIAKLVIKRQ